MNNNNQNFMYQPMSQQRQSMPIEVRLPEPIELLQWVLPEGDKQPLQGCQPQQGYQPLQVQQSLQAYQTSQQLPQFHDYPAVQGYLYGPQGYQQCSAASGEHEYIRKAEIDCQKEGRIAGEKALIDIDKYRMKCELDEESRIRILKARADIEIKKANLESHVEILSDGNIVKKQEFLAEYSKEYGYANFKINEKPVLYITEGKKTEILKIAILNQMQERKVLYFNLDMSNPGYYSKKIRKEGLRIRNCQSEKHIVLELIQQLRDMAELTEIPYRSGFYAGNNQKMLYAAKEDLIWKEVEEYAK